MPRWYETDAARSPERNAIGLTRRDEEDLYASLRDQQRYLASQRDESKKGSSVTHRFLQSIEVGAGATAVGLAAGRLGHTGIGTTGVPLGLAVAAAGYTAAFFGLAGGYEEHLLNVSDGAAAGWLTMWGAGAGSQMRAKATGDTNPIVSGIRAPQPLPPPSPASPSPYYAAPAALPPSGYRVAPFVQAPLTAQQLASVAQRHRYPLTEAELHSMGR